MKKHIDRLEYMSGPDSHEKWDLSDNDKAAISYVLARNAALERVAECARPFAESAQGVIQVSLREQRLMEALAALDAEGEKV